MTEFRFYHLTKSKAPAALASLLGRTLAAGHRAVVRCGGPDRVAELDDALWETDWLPHGTTDPELQPIWLTDADEAPNGGRYLFLLDGTTTGRPEAFDRISDLFDGADQTAVAAARLRWTATKAAGHALEYWQQTPTGWTKQA